MAIISSCPTPTRVPAGQAVFNSSTVWTVPRGVKVVDIFCVGGGSSGSRGWYRPEYTSDIEAEARGGLGGNGGFTKTVLGASVTPRSTIAVTVGAGGAECNNHNYQNPGGNSSFGSICVAEGGKTSLDSSTGLPRSGASGGSGGGGKSSCSQPYDQQGSVAGDGTGNNGGSNGGDGEVTINWDRGKGQGTTTRAFGEAGGTLYSGGGGSGEANAESSYNQGVAYTTNIPAGNGGAGGGGTNAAGTPNTGGGGAGGRAQDIVGYGQSGNSYTDPGYPGGSGVVMVRWAEQ